MVDPARTSKRGKGSSRCRSLIAGRPWRLPQCLRFFLYTSGEFQGARGVARGVAVRGSPRRGSSLRGAGPSPELRAADQRGRRPRRHWKLATQIWLRHRCRPKNASEGSRSSPHLPQRFSKFNGRIEPTRAGKNVRRLGSNARKHTLTYRPSKTHQIRM